MKLIELTKEQTIALAKQVERSLEQVGDSEEILTDIEFDDGLTVEAVGNVIYTWSNYGWRDEENWYIDDASVSVTLKAYDDVNDYDIIVPIDIQDEIANLICE